MEFIRNFFNKIYDNSLKIQNYTGLIYGLLSLLFVLIFIGAIIYFAKGGELHSLSFVGGIFKVMYVLVWICAVLLIIFGSINIYKGATWYGIIAIIFGLLWVMIHIFNIGFDFEMVDNATQLCFSSDIWNLIAAKNYIRNIGLKPEPTSNL
jgi:hypothetical protein